MDFPFAKLAEDISTDSPSGEDLELVGDADFMRFMAQIDGVLPLSYASFDRSAVDLPAYIQDVGGLLAKSKDLRLITASAKLFILNRDLAGFEKAVSAIAQWLGERWDTLLPELLDGDPMLRAVALQSLDDVPHTVKPLEAAPLFKSRRAGGVSLRLALLAEGKIQPRESGEGEKEAAPSQGDIFSAIREADLEEMVAAREHAIRLAAALEAIEARWDEKSGRVGELRFRELGPKAKEVCLFLERAVVSRDPALAKITTEAATESGDDSEEPAPGADARPAGAITSLEEAKAAMMAAERYLRTHEPSSPVRLVLAQAAALIGKSFYESLEQLVPDLASQASVGLGRDLPLKLPMERLAQLLPSGDSDEDESEDDADVEESETYNDASSDEGRSDGSDTDPEAGAGEDSDQAAPVEDEREVYPARTPPAAAPERPKRFKATKRHDALVLLDAAAVYFRTAEPSSAIPMLLDIARNAAGRDFMTLLRETLPPRALRIDD